MVKAVNTYTNETNFWDMKCVHALEYEFRILRSKERVWKLRCVHLFSLPTSCWNIGKNFYFEFAFY
jgi:hypothetical protein